MRALSSGGSFTAGASRRAAAPMQQRLPHTRPPPSAPAAHRPPRPPARAVCTAAAGGGGVNLRQSLKPASQGSSDPVYVAAATYLKTIGFTNQAEVARVLDIAMNPNSLFVSYNDPKRSRNASARELDVKADMEPVVEFLTSKGLRSIDVVAVIAGHPPVLSYSVGGRLEPFWEYMAGTVGIEDVGAALLRRPSLLGLDLENVEKIVGYLRSVDTPPETIVKYMLTTI